MYIYEKPELGRVVKFSKFRLPFQVDPNTGRPLGEIKTLPDKFKLPYTINPNDGKPIDGSNNDNYEI